MPKLHLTDIAIQKLPKPEKGQVTYWDSTLPSFGVRVSQGGSKSFIIMMQGKRKLIGRYPVVTLKHARTEAKRILFDRLGYEKQQVEVSYEEAVDRYLEKRSSELRANTIRGYSQALKRVNLPLVVSDIKAYHIEDELDRIDRKVAKTATYTALKVFFGWCVMRDYCDSNPMQKLKKPQLPTARDRVLSDDELAVIWFACNELGKYGAIVKLLMLTGQRPIEIASLETAWLGKKSSSVTFPAWRMKSKKEHFCPLGKLSQGVLMGVQPIEGYFFSPATAVGHPFTAWSKNKKRLDNLVQLDPWALRDLRRTWGSNAPRVNIPEHITSRILGHTSEQGKLAKIYNRYLYREEMADAMARMNSHILSLIEPDTT